MSVLDDRRSRLAPGGRLGQRGIVLAFLREAQPHGVEQRTITLEGGVRDVAMHVESLIAEGHIIRRMDGRYEDGHALAKYYLIQDEWAELPSLVEG